MKSYLVVLFALLSFVGFGQISEEEAVPKISNFIFCSFELPMPEEGFFHDADYNHFQELFPSDKLKKTGIKLIYITSKDKGDIPTIGAESLQPYYKYILNNDGFVIKSESVIDSWRHSSIYERNNLNQIVYSRDSTDLHIFQDKFFCVTEKKYTYNSNTMTELSNSMIGANGNSFVIGGNSLFAYDTVISIKTYDQYNRLSQVSYNYIHSSLDLKILSSDYSKINFTFYYDENQHFGLLHKTRSNDTIFFDQNWRPIKELDLHDYDLFNQKEIVYNFNNQIVSLKIIIYEEEEAIEEAESTEEVIEEVEIIYEAPEKEVTMITFHYNSDGLLEKIIQTTNDGTCEYRVYYYTE